MIAIMPPLQLTEAIQKIRVNFADKYHCRAGLKPPVHITLLPTYAATIHSESILYNHFTEWAKMRSSFTITVHNFSTFKKSRVLYIDVVKNQILENFQKDLVTLFHQLLPEQRTKDTHPYKPHITIGYRDISETIFPQIAAEYEHQEFDATFLVSEFHLWKHNGKNWETLYSFPLKS